jgi:hypothetical protein
MTARVKLVIHPAGSDTSDVNAADFLQQVSALRRLVLLSVHDVDAVEAKIVDLSRNSPATIELEAFWRHDQRPLEIDRYFSAVRSVFDRGEAPKELARAVFDTLKEFVSVVGKGVRESVLQIGDQKIRIEHQARLRVESAIEPDYSVDGTIDGMLEAVNVHNNRNQFVLYPIIGPTRVNCYFPDEMLDEVRPVLGKYAIVTGTMKYRWREKFPFEARATQLEQVSESDQPYLPDVIGLAPQATGGECSENFVKEIRSAWG